MLSKVSYNDKHGNLSLLKYFYPLLQFENLLVIGMINIEIQFVKMLGLLHLMNFDPILKLTDENLVIKNVSVFS